jgi:hypothetical protein
MKQTSIRYWMSLCVVAGVLFGAQAAAGEHSFVGSKKCKLCHLKQYKSWEQTPMAGTFDTLKAGERAEQKQAAGLDPAKDYTADAACVRCHVTGYGQPGGFTSLAETPDLVGVGCETCHGPGSTYLKPEHMSLKNKEYKKADLIAVGMVGEITEAQCTGCHNDESPFVGEDFVFDFEARKGEGIHEHHELKYPH